MTSLPVRRIWITGAGSGIGKCLALQLAAQGHQVFISGRNQQALENLAAQNKGNMVPVPCDASNDELMASLFVDSGIESLDTAIFCAGICEYIDMPVLDMGKIRRAAESNYFGVVNSCIAALPLLKKSSLTPHIIGLCSMSSYVGFPRAEAYGSSKAAMSYFLESLRADLNGQVDITVVYPGFVKTPMTDQNDFPMPFLISAEKAAEIIVKKAEKHPLSIAFPLRLNFILHVMRVFPSLWKKVSGRISRNEVGQE